MEAWVLGEGLLSVHGRVHGRDWLFPAPRLLAVCPGARQLTSLVCKKEIISGYGEVAGRVSRGLAECLLRWEVSVSDINWVSMPSA